MYDKCVAIAATLALLLLSAASRADDARPDALLVVDQHRQAIIERTIAAWPEPLSTARSDALRELLWSLRADRLLAVSLSPTAREIANAPDRQRAPDEPSAVHPKALGEPLADLVYTPLTPCRIVDTRNAVGALAASTTRTLLGYHASSFAAQGGTASSCAIPNGVAALAMNVYAVNPSALGFIKLWASNQPEPAVSTVNYEPPTVAIATGAIVPVDGGDSNKFKAESPAAVHLVVDVVGYFRSVTAPGSGLRIVQATNSPFGSSPNVVNGAAANASTRTCPLPLSCIGTEPVVGGTVAGGGAVSAANRVTDSFGTVGGGAGNRAGNDDNDGIDAPYATVGGGVANVASGTQSTVGGGTMNHAGGLNSFVGGGNANVVPGQFSTIAGGNHNSIPGWYSAIGGGSSNEVTGGSAVIAGGQTNQAAGDFATVPGGSSNHATGNYSFAAGQNARAHLNGCFVWSDSTTGITECGVANAFVARAKGGFYLITGGSHPSYTGALLAPGSTSWTVLSDRNEKENVRPIDADEVLEKVAALPVATWNWRTQGAAVRHAGPMAQDFHALFGLGESPLGISTVDADGIAFAAIQGLHARLKRSIAEKDTAIAALLDRTERLERELEAIRQRLVIR